MLIFVSIKLKHVDDYCFNNNIDEKQSLILRVDPQNLVSTWCGNNTK